MAFQFEKASCVVVGTFNIYILHPGWLAKHGIVETGVEVTMESNLARPGFRFRFPKDESIWTVAPDRLSIETRCSTLDCGRIVAAILAKLPETPLFALGNNSHYRADLPELAGLSEAIRNLPAVESPGGWALNQRTFHTGVKRGEDESVNLQIAIKDDGIALACNAHHELSNRDDANTAAIAAADRFLEERAECKALAQHFFGTAIDHVSDT